METLNNTSTKTWQWLNANRGSLPALLALAAVAAFWTVGLLGGMAFLHESHPPMTTLIGLYLMLAMVAVTIIIAVLAASDLTRRHTKPKDAYQRV